MPFWCSGVEATSAGADEFPNTHPVCGEAAWRAAGAAWAEENADVLLSLSRTDMFNAVQVYMTPRTADLDVVSQCLAGNAAYSAAWEARLATMKR